LRGTRSSFPSWVAGPFFVLCSKQVLSCEWMSDSDITRSGPQPSGTVRIDPLAPVVGASGDDVPDAIPNLDSSHGMRTSSLRIPWEDPKMITEKTSQAVKSVNRNQ